jgi:hypothetical protein
MIQLESSKFLRSQTALLRASYLYWTGEHLTPAELNDDEAIEVLMHAPFAVVSHDSASDPIFNYANQHALEIFEMDWQEFTQLPSRLSAETDNQEKRSKALNEVSRNGFVRNYSGIRIAKSGRRFWIRDTTIWNLVTPDGQLYGQAARINATMEV